MLPLSGISIIRKTFLAVLGIPPFTNGEVLILMAFVEDQGAVPENGHDVILHDENADWHMAFPHSTENYGEEQPLHEFPLYFTYECMDDDGYMDHLRNGSCGAMNALKSMAMDGLDGDYAAVYEKKAWLGHAITCLPQLRPFKMDYASKLYGVMSLLLYFLRLHRHMHKSKKLRGKNWICPGCFETIQATKGYYPTLWYVPHLNLGNSF